MKKFVSVIIILSMIFALAVSPAAADSGRIDSAYTYDVGTKHFDIEYGTFTTSEDSKGTAKDYACETNYYFSDGFFFEDPTVYNKHLASVSESMADASMPPNPFWSTHLRDSQDIEKFLKELGFSNVFINDEFNRKPTRSSVGFAIATKDLKYSDGTSTGSKLIVVVPRSAGYDMEWASNFLAGPSGDLKGFDDASNKIITAVEEYISNQNLTQYINNGKVCFWTAGHSRGGSISCSTAKKLIDKYVTAGGNRVYAYASAVSKLADESSKVDSKKQFYNSIHNIISTGQGGKTDDIVCLAAPDMPDQTFIRYGQEHPLKMTKAECEKQLSYINYTRVNGAEYSEKFDVAYLAIDLDLSLISNISDLTSGDAINQIIPVCTSGSAQSVTQEQFIEDCVEYLTLWGFVDRSSYTGTTYSMTLSNSQASNTREGALCDYLVVKNALTQPQFDIILNIAGDITNHIDLGDLKLITAVKNWNSMKWKKTSFLEILQTYKTDIIEELWDLLSKCKYTSGGITYTLESYLTTADMVDEDGTSLYELARRSFPAMVDLLLSVVSYDYNKSYTLESKKDLYGTGKKGIILSTIVRNIIVDGASMFTEHYNGVYFAKIRTEDSWYANNFVLTNGKQVLDAGTMNTKYLDGTDACSVILYDEQGKKIKRVMFEDILADNNMSTCCDTANIDISDYVAAYNGVKSVEIDYSGAVDLELAVETGDAELVLPVSEDEFDATDYADGSSKLCFLVYDNTGKITGIVTSDKLLDESQMSVEGRKLNVDLSEYAGTGDTVKLEISPEPIVEAFRTSEIVNRAVSGENASLDLNGDGYINESDISYMRGLMDA